MNLKDQLKEIDKLKAQLDAYRPFSKHILSQLKEYYRIGLTYASNALEGNSLTETETKIVIEDGLTIGGKPLRDHAEALGHSEAYDALYELAKKGIVSEAGIKKLHRLFYYRIDDKNAGKYRKVKVFISGSKAKFPGPDQVPDLMERFVSQIPDFVKKHHPVEQAAWLHREFVFIHPFIDGNGRVSRLLMNLVLIHQGYGLAIIPPVLRRDYIVSLEKAHSGKNQSFVQFIAGTVRETLRDTLRLLKD